MLELVRFTHLRQPGLRPRSNTILCILMTNPRPNLSPFPRVLVLGQDMIQSALRTSSVKICDLGTQLRPHVVKIHACACLTTHLVASLAAKAVPPATMTAAICSLAEGLATEACQEYAMTSGRYRYARIEQQISGSKIHNTCIAIASTLILIDPETAACTSSRTPVGRTSACRYIDWSHLTVVETFHCTADFAASTFLHLVKAAVSAMPSLRLF